MVECQYEQDPDPIDVAVSGTVASVACAIPDLTTSLRGTTHHRPHSPKYGNHNVTAPASQDKFLLFPHWIRNRISASIHVTQPKSHTEFPASPQIAILHHFDPRSMFVHYPSWPWALTILFVVYVGSVYARRFRNARKIKQLGDFAPAVTSYAPFGMLNASTLYHRFLLTNPRS